MTRNRQHFFAQAASVLIFCTAGCTTPTAPEAQPEREEAPPVLASPVAAAPSAPPPAPENLLVIPAAEPVVTLQPVSEPRYALPESLKQFRFPQKNQAKPVVTIAKPPPKAAASEGPAKLAPKASAPLKPVESLALAASHKSAKAPVAEAKTDQTIELNDSPVLTVTAGGEAPRYKLPDSLKDWHSGRKVPLYTDPEAAPWQATPTEARLRNAAVSCNYKDEGGVRGKVMLLINDFKVSRFNARIEMPNGGVCQFDVNKMKQRPFEQGIELESTGDECVVRMWEQKHRLTIAAYSCHKQCSKGSFSYLWPILMDTRIGTCY